MSLRSQMSLVSSGNLTLKQKSKSEKKYFFKVSSSESALTFSNCFSSSPRVQKPTSGYSRQSFLQTHNAPPLRTKSSLKEKDSRTMQYPNDKFKAEIKSKAQSPQRQIRMLGEKEESLRSTDGTHSSLVREFELILSNNRRASPTVHPEIKQNKTNSLKHERTKSSEDNNQLHSQQKIKANPSPDNKSQKRDSKLNQYKQIDDYPQQMKQTILQFQNVLDNNSVVEIRRPKQEVQQLNQEINKLRLLLKQRDRVWEQKLNESLKKQKTLVVQSFKKMLSELKKMCEWQKFGGDSVSLNQPPSLITSSKKLFHNYPFQHQFKDSMEQIRNTLMQLKIINSQSQSLREELQNLRRVLEEERQIKQNLQEQLERQKQSNKKMFKELAENKQREDEFRIRIISLENIIKLLKQQRTHYPSYTQHYQKITDPQSNSHPIQFNISSSKIIIRNDVKSYEPQNRKLGEKLVFTEVEKRRKYSAEDNKRTQRLEQPNHASPSKFRHTDQKKNKTQLQQNVYPISFRTKRKVSNQAPVPSKQTQQGDGRNNNNMAG